VKEKLKEIAAQSEGGKQKVGAILATKSGLSLVETTNAPTKTHPTQKEYAEKAGSPSSIYLHAEIRALILDKSDNSHTLYVGRINKEGELTMAKPCSVCRRAIQEAGLERVFYTNFQGEFEEMEND